MCLDKTALVLEGGGLRGIFSAGVLDYLMAKDMYFPYVIGVSMGACNGASYVSKQPERSLRIPLNYLEDTRYLSFRNLLKEGNLFGMDFIFGEVPLKLDPFDFNTFEASKQTFIAVATDCMTGKPAYFNKEELTREELMVSLKASTSLPFLSTMKEMGGHKYLDGGIADSIPVTKAAEDGYKKQVIVLTRPVDYRKDTSKGARILTKGMYRKYPALAERIVKRAEHYNATLAYIEKEEKAGRFFVIRPEEPIVMPRIGKDKSKLKSAYALGYEIMKERFEELETFLA